METTLDIGGFRPPGCATRVLRPD